MYLTDIGEKLKSTREKIGFSQMEIEKETGIPQETISRIEKGKRLPSLENLSILCDFYEISADWLLGTGKNKRG